MIMAKKLLTEPEIMQKAWFDRNKKKVSRDGKEGDYKATYRDLIGTINQIGLKKFKGMGIEIDKGRLNEKKTKDSYSKEEMIDFINKYFIAEAQVAAELENSEDGLQLEKTAKKLSEREKEIRVELKRESPLFKEERDFFKFMNRKIQQNYRFSRKGYFVSLSWIRRSKIQQRREYIDQRLGKKELGIVEANFKRLQEIKEIIGEQIDRCNSFGKTLERERGIMEQIKKELEEKKSEYFRNLDKELDRRLKLFREEAA